MKSSLKDSSSPCPSLSPPASTDSTNINGKYNAHKDSEFSEFKGGSVEIVMQKDVNLCPQRGDIEEIHKDAPWVAALAFRVKDVAEAMKQGLYWSQDNVDPTGSCYYDDIQPLARQLQDWGFTHSRRFQLIDLAENPQWKGTLLVYSRGIKGLSQFRIHNISVDNITFTTAFTGEIDVLLAAKFLSLGDTGRAILCGHIRLLTTLEDILIIIS